MSSYMRNRNTTGHSLKYSTESLKKQIFHKDILPCVEEKCCAVMNPLGNKLKGPSQSQSYASREISINRYVILKVLCSYLTVTSLIPTWIFSRKFPSVSVVELTGNSFSLPTREPLRPPLKIGKCNYTDKLLPIQIKMIIFTELSYLITR